MPEKPLDSGDGKKIAFVTKSLFGGGAEKNVLTLAEWMAKAGHEVHIFLLKNLIHYPVSHAYQIHALSETGRVSPFRFLNHLNLAKRLRQKIAGQSFDLVISTLTDADRVVHAAKLPCLVYYRLCNTLSEELAAYQKTHGWWKMQHRKRRYLRIYRHHPLIAVSKGVAEDLIKNFQIPPADITQIYNPIDVMRIRKLSDESSPDLPREDYIIHVGRFAGQKRHDLLLQAFKQVKTDCKLLLLTHACPELSALIHQYGLEDRVISPGFQPNPYPWIKGARLMVLSSDREGFGLVVAEALACGTPVVSTDCPSGPAEILTQELAHWLTPRNDVNALTKKIEEALGTQIRIPENILDRFKPDYIVDQYLKLCHCERERSNPDSRHCERKRSNPVRTSI